MCTLFCRRVLYRGRFGHFFEVYYLEPLCNLCKAIENRFSKGPQTYPSTGALPVPEQDAKGLVRLTSCRAHFTIVESTILYYTILYYTILYYTILYYTILYYTILYYTILYHTHAHLWKHDHFKIFSGPSAMTCQVLSHLCAMCADIL